ncbi:hypothetical protein LEP1GSC193_1033 [Leptospira alstonii serovar Pingchang str. 80-412]|uniref:Uncharacterized protein n=2 Tax=Leptospira alstonii TaxID=28452 RepID=M6CJ69_9LEPT|nr:hypothetical protein LEP1GSC194_1080 [Leptospira alstonii serovar Sichuan str. 79601]EQA82372.1 hypothetical protein LEP1GSC193_1033 [Leptospira alstonii serovar Pingchang str. 80-412]
MRAAHFEKSMVFLKTGNYGVPRRLVLFYQKGLVAELASWASIIRKFEF